MNGLKSGLGCRTCLVYWTPEFDKMGKQSLEEQLKNSFRKILETLPSGVEVLNVKQRMAYNALSLEDDADGLLVRAPFGQVFQMLPISFS